MPIRETLKGILYRYKQVEKHILYLVAAEFFIQMVNSSFFLLYNYHMEANGYLDYEITKIFSFRFIMVLVLGLPLGFYLKRTIIKPFFLAAAFIVPSMALLSIYGAYYKMDALIKVSMMIWGIGFASIQIAGLPFILMYSKKENQSEAISLFFQMWSIAIFLAGLFNYLLHNWNPDFFDEGMVLSIYSIIGFLAIPMILKIDIKERPKNTEKFIWRSLYDDYDWKLIIAAVIPTLIIAMGAGFTIPVINLFFSNVHGVESDAFSIYGAMTYAMVAIGMTFMPYIKRTFGYQTAITLFQSLAVLALFLMTITEYFKTWEYAAAMAIFFYIIRQPLMNVAGPMTSELTMYYVGKKNQELIAALNSSIWSGSWLLTMHIFSGLRESGYAYASIFLITVVMYVIGVVWYAGLIRSYNKRLDIEEVETMQEELN